MINLIAHPLCQWSNFKFFLYLHNRYSSRCCESKHAVIVLCCFGKHIWTHWRCFQVATPQLKNPSYDTNASCSVPHSVSKLVLKYSFQRACHFFLLQFTTRLVCVCATAVMKAKTKPTNIEQHNATTSHTKYRGTRRKSKRTSQSAQLPKLKFKLVSVGLYWSQLFDLTLQACGWILPNGFSLRSSFQVRCSMHIESHEIDDLPMTDFPSLISHWDAWVAKKSPLSRQIRNIESQSPFRIQNKKWYTQ